MNREKHGISFETAKYVFADPERKEFYDYQHSSWNEDRFVTIGRVRDVIVVAYTMRRNSMRLISARRATEMERDIYYGND